MRTSWVALPSASVSFVEHLETLAPFSPSLRLAQLETPGLLTPLQWASPLAGGRHSPPFMPGCSATDCRGAVPLRYQGRPARPLAHRRRWIQGPAQASTQDGSGPRWVLGHRRWHHPRPSVVRRACPSAMPGRLRVRPAVPDLAPQRSQPFILQIRGSSTSCLDISPALIYGSSAEDPSQCFLAPSSGAAGNPGAPGVQSPEPLPESPVERRRS